MKNLAINQILINTSVILNTMLPECNYKIES